MAQVTETRPQIQALEKLSAEEANALVAPLAAVALSYRKEASQSGSKIRDLDLVLATYREIMERLNKPLKWLGPRGEEYDTYAEYLEGVWGVETY